MREFVKQVVEGKEDQESSSENYGPFSKNDSLNEDNYRNPAALEGISKNGENCAKKLQNE